MRSGRTIRARLLVLAAAILLPILALLLTQGYRDFSGERAAAAASATRLAEIAAAGAGAFVAKNKAAGELVPAIDGLLAAAFRAPDRGR